jgi:hypothetical protein
MVGGDAGTGLVGLGLVLSGHTLVSDTDQSGRTPTAALAEVAPESIRPLVGSEGGVTRRIAVVRIVVSSTDHSVRIVLS